MKTMILSIGRFTPPHKGHGILLEYIKDRAKDLDCDYAIWVTQTKDNTKNLLPIERKQYYLEQFFPETIFRYFNASINTITKVLESYTGIYDKIIFVVGSDRVECFKNFMMEYNHKDFSFKQIEIEACSERNEYNNSSSTLVRRAVEDNDYKRFLNLLPQNSPETVQQELFLELKGHKVALKKLQNKKTVPLLNAQKKKEWIKNEIRLYRNNAARLTEKEDLISLLDCLTDSNMPSIRSIQGQYSLDDFKKCGIFNVADYIKPVSFKIKSKPKNTADRIKSASVFLSKDVKWLCLNGVLLDGENSKIVASNAYILAVYYDNSLLKETKIVDIKTGETIAAKYPDYQTAIRKETNVFKTVFIQNPQRLLDRLNGLAKISKIVGKHNLNVSLSFGQEDYAYRMDYLKTVFGEAARNKTGLKISFTKFGSLFVRAGDNVFIVMPMEVDYRGAIATLDISEYF